MTQLHHSAHELLSRLDGFRVEIDAARERADIILDRPGFNIISMPQRDQLRAVFEKPAMGSALAVAYPGYSSPDEESNKRTLVSGSLAFLLHAGALATLILFASLAPLVEEEILPVQLLKEEAPDVEEPAPAPKALAERRALPFNPAVQTVTPQIINPRVIAEAAPKVAAEALQMDAVSAVAAPTSSSPRRSCAPATTTCTSCCGRASTARWARRSRSSASRRGSTPTGRRSTPTSCSPPSTRQCRGSGS